MGRVNFSRNPPRLAAMNRHRPPLDIAGVRRDLVGPGRALRSIEVVDST